MTRKQYLKRAMAELKRGIEGTVEEAQAQSARTGSEGRHNFNVVHRANVIVSKNVGRDSSVHGASAKQMVHIRQMGAGCPGR